MRTNSKSCTNGLVGRWLRWLSTCVSLTLAVGCGGSRSVDESQIAVRVNDGEISVHQVQAVLQRQSRLGATSAAPEQVLEVLIEQELAAQAAVRQGLESDPAVIQSLQLARRETLARAYHDLAAARPVLPTSDEIDRYYETHPALFAQRQLYTFQELMVEADPTQMDDVSEAIKLANGADAAVAVVRERGVPFTVRRITYAAEDIPMGLLDQLFKTPVGRSIVVPGKGGARVFSVLSAQAAPLDRRTAAPAITKFLVAERRRVAVAESMSGLRKDARLRYLGAFAKPAGSPAKPTAASKAQQQ